MNETVSWFESSVSSSFSLFPFLFFQIAHSPVLILLHPPVSRLFVTYGLQIFSVSSIFLLILILWSRFLHLLLPPFLFRCCACSSSSCSLAFLPLSSNQQPSFLFFLVPIISLLCCFRSSLVSLSWLLSVSLILPSPCLFLVFSLWQVQSRLFMQSPFSLLSSVAPRHGCSFWWEE